MRSELRRFLTRPSCREPHRQHQWGAQVAMMVRVRPNLVDQATFRKTLPQHEEVALDADETGDLLEQVARRLVALQRCDGARESVAAAAEGEFDRARVRPRRARRLRQAADGGADRHAAEAEEEGEHREREHRRCDKRFVIAERTLQERFPHAYALSSLQLFTERGVHTGQ